MERPLRLFDPPVRVDVAWVTAEGPPIRFMYAQRPRTVHRHWGPERIETAWWRGPIVRRDYYRVETDEGTFFWLFRRLDDNSWFLHGEFE
jgi:protein ImuB